MANVFALLMFLIIKEGTGNSAFSVTFENPNPCAPKGSSVVFRCSYSYREGETVRKTTWYRGILNGSFWTRVALSDLPSFENRLEYLGDRQHNCSLAIHNLQFNDAGYYYFRFDTDTHGFRSKQSVYLSVTELNVRVYPERVRAGENVTLECKTSCYHGSSTVWFKDGRQIPKPGFPARAEDSGNYVCAIRGQESMQSDPVVLDVQYGPLNMSIEVSQLHPNGTSVTLTCRTTANPATINYTWYRIINSSSISMVHVGSGQVLSLPTVESSHSGLYLCQARNSVGKNNVTELLLIGRHTDINHYIIVGTGVKMSLVLLLTPIIILIYWKKICYSAEDKKEQDDGYENTSST